MKKKRGGLRLLSRVEVSELRLWWTADPPRPFQLRPVPRNSAAGFRSRDFYSRLIYRRLSVFRFHRVAPVSSSVSRTCVPFTCRLFRLAPSELWTFRCRSCFRSGPSGAEALSDPDLPMPKLLPIFSTFTSLSCFRSVTW